MASRMETSESQTFSNPPEKVADVGPNNSGRQGVVHLESVHGSLSKLPDQTLQLQAIALAPTNPSGRRGKNNE
ncbi:hypothetical protein N7532_006692 [Penicillium argentinense]|uniref:Uncharacterized protein n=1 Tax=Penicillium argentinense TaxID=1131581 RepID=A0A9W9KBI6_9EURO|nr:uncharacterized protein N7532_006692 [Penicillium argentinense]KAJ5099691.1 hypothetical protein N7532_006692 [Penicillium argentinense]